MTIFSSDPVISFVVTLLTVIGVIALGFSVAERRKPILQAFFFSVTSAAAAVVCMLESAWTEFKPWDYGVTLFGVLMYAFALLIAWRWWRWWRRTA